MTRTAGLFVGVLAGLALLLAPASASAAPPFGALTQLSGSDSCVGPAAGYSDAYPDPTCGSARGVPTSLAIAPDGAHLYYASPGPRSSPTVFGFARGARGKLTELGSGGCASEDPFAGCLDARMVLGASAIAISPTGGHLYVGAGEDGYDHGIAVLQRNSATGVLSQDGSAAGCASASGFGGGCVRDATLRFPKDIAMSSDGASVYVAHMNGLSAFSRNSTSGGLSAVSCGSCGWSGGQAVAVSPDGKHVYLASGSPSYVIAIYNRNTTTGALTYSKCLSEPGLPHSSTCGNLGTGSLLPAWDLNVSSDSKNLYATGGFIGVFSRNSTSGDIAPLPGSAGCVSTWISGCTSATAAGSPIQIVTSPDGKNAYVSSWGDHAVAAFSRNTTTGALTQLADTFACISDTGSGGVCTDGQALRDVKRLAISADGANVYTGNDHGMVAVLKRQVATNCDDASASTLYETPVAVSLPCSNINGNAVTRSIVAGPSRGTLGAVDQGSGSVTYTPGPDFVGTDSFTFRATSIDGESTIARATITVNGVPPAATTGSASNVSTSGAFLGYSVAARGQPTTFWIEYGTTQAYGGQLDLDTISNGFESGTGSLSSLASNTTYHYRVVAQNASGTTYGSDATFTTLKRDPAPLTGDAWSPDNYHIVFRGQVTPGDDPGSYYFEWRKPGDQWSQTTVQQVPAGNAAFGVEAEVTAWQGFAGYPQAHEYRLVTGVGGRVIHGQIRTHAGLPHVAPFEEDLRVAAGSSDVVVRFTFDSNRSLAQRPYRAGYFLALCSSQNGVNHEVLNCSYRGTPEGIVSVDAETAEIERTFTGLLPGVKYDLRVVPLYCGVETLPNPNIDTSCGDGLLTANGNLHSPRIYSRSFTTASGIAPPTAPLDSSEMLAAGGFSTQAGCSAACAIDANLSVAAPAGSGRAAASGARKVVVARGHRHLGARARGKIRLKLTAAGRRLLKQRGWRRLKGTLRAAVRSGGKTRVRRAAIRIKR